jgi:hypothetical protein
MAPSYNDMRNIEKERLVSSIINHMETMELHDLQILEKSAKNMDVLKSFIKSFRVLLTWG